MKHWPQPTLESVIAANLAGLLTMRGGMDVTRDNELLRRLMYEIEGCGEWIYVPDEADEDAYFHLRMLADDRLLEENGRVGNQWRMTMSGHDFCALMREDEAWEKAKAAANRDDITLAALKEIAMGFLRERIAEAFGFNKP